MNGDPKKKKKVTQETMKRDYLAARSTPDRIPSLASRSYSAPAPRVGGTVSKSRPLISASKSQMKRAKKMVRRGTGSGAKRKY